MAKMNRAQALYDVRLPEECDSSLPIYGWDAARAKEKYKLAMLELMDIYTDQKPHWLPHFIGKFIECIELAREWVGIVRLYSDGLGQAHCICAFGNFR